MLNDQISDLGSRLKFVFLVSTSGAAYAMVIFISV